jgi:hypothetical protein
MNRAEYEIRSAIAAHRLAVKSGVQVLHGEAGVCPHCCTDGTFSLGIGYLDAANDIYWSEVWKDWRCIRCEYARIC